MLQNNWQLSFIGTQEQNVVDLPMPSPQMAIGQVLQNINNYWLNLCYSFTLGAKMLSLNSL